jgi:hypothetical protein
MLEVPDLMPGGDVFRNVGGVLADAPQKRRLDLVEER